jgi:hypothetical protein
MFSAHPPTSRAGAAQAPAFLGHVRVTGTLAEDAHVGLTTGQPPHMLLWLHLKPAAGMPYLARVDLGDDTVDHMKAEAMLPDLRRGAVVSVAALALEPRTDHGHAALRLVQPHSVVLLQHPVDPAQPAGCAAAPPAATVADATTTTTATTTATATA